MLEALADQPLGDVAPVHAPLIAEVAARLRFVAKAQRSRIPFTRGHRLSGETEELVERWLSTAARPLDAADLQRRLDGLEEVTRSAEAALIRDDASRFFTITRRLNGDYYRQAAWSAVLGRVWGWTYSHDLSIFDQVLAAERSARPAMH